MIDLFLSEQLDAFARCGTLSRAAEELHITQPALSRNMKRLESLMGVSLFRRENSKIALNETGKVAAEYARRVLEANREMIDMTLAFDRNQRTISIGSCATLPIYEIMPLMQEHFMDKAITTELADDVKLLAGLRNHNYQLAVFPGLPENDDLFCQRYIEETLCVSFPPSHPLAQRESITFVDLNGVSVIAAGNAGFWIPVCEHNMPPRNLVIQKNVEALAELVESSSMPVFSSDRIVSQGRGAPGRVTIPISDPAAHVTYYIACLNSDRYKYDSLFNSIRAAIIRH